MDPDPKKSKDSPSSSATSSGSSHTHSPFPNEVLEKVLSLMDSDKDRGSVSLVCKDCVSRTVARRFPRIKSVTLKGEPRCHELPMLPWNWGANVHSWVVMFAKVYPFLEELRLKRMTICDESLELLAKSFPGFKALSLSSSFGFTSNGLKAIATHCRNLTELNIQDDDSMYSVPGCWLSCFPENFASLEILNFACLNTDVSFDALERLVSRCRSLRVLKVNQSITLDQLQRLLVHAPHVMELGTGFFWQQLTPRQYEDIESAFNNCKNLQVLSFSCQTSARYLPVLYEACAGLTFLNLRRSYIQSGELAKLLPHCSNLRRLWVPDTVKDKGLKIVGSSCPLLEELRVLQSSPLDLNDRGVTELGLLDVSRGCSKLHYVFYYCRRMTNASVVTIVRNCPNFTHFRLCIRKPDQPDYLTNKPLDEAFAAVVKNCTKLRRLSVSGLVTDLTFDYIGKCAKNLETLSVAFAGGSSDRGMQCVLEGCPKLRKLEIRDCPFGNDALLSGLEKYEMIRSLWMSGCNITIKGCKLLAREMPRLNVEVIEDEESDDDIRVPRLNVEVINDEESDNIQPKKVYVYRSLAGPRQDAPPSVLTL
ncbi:hypothetical protein DH2020_008934 [Rehmannia glutinosa]|uniref:Uncharacterized protein n=1 Tax=Rehmannia glutinosa TaxID=99300 RepID=A0ABR0X4V1_REHGL